MEAKPLRRPVLLALLLWTAGCHDPDAYTLSPGRIEQFVSITTSVAAIPADGIARITITVRIDPLTDIDRRLIKLTATAGTLIWGNQEGLSVLVPADDTGIAVVELRSGSTPGLVRIDIAVGSLSRSTTVQFTAVRREDLFDVEVNRTSIPADGFSTARITVTLHRLGTTAQRIVKFETSGGTLLSTGIATARQASVTATNGIAVIDLQSDKTVGPVRLTVTALERTEDLELSFVPADPATIITLSANPGSAAADGVTAVTVIARVAANLPTGRRSVLFRTTLGHFLPGTRDEFSIDADGSNTAHATLVSLTVGEARLTATVDGTTANAGAQFTVALPESLFVSAAAAALRSGESTLVTVTLLRQTGQVSPRLQVNYSAVTNGSSPIGAFSGVSLSERGVSTATFNVGPTSYVGPVTIRASVNGGADGTASVQIVP